MTMEKPTSGSAPHCVQAGLHKHWNCTKRRTTLFRLPEDQEQMSAIMHPKGVAPAPTLLHSTAQP